MCLPHPPPRISWEVQSAKNSALTGKITDHPAGRRWRYFQQCGCGQNLRLFGRIRIGQHINDFQFAAVLQFFVARLLHNVDGTRGAGGRAGDEEA